MVEFLISLLPTFTPFYIKCSSCFLGHILGHANAFSVAAFYGSGNLWWYHYVQAWPLGRYTSQCRLTREASFLWPRGWGYVQMCTGQAMGVQLALPGTLLTARGPGTHTTHITRMCNVLHFPFPSQTLLSTLKRVLVHLQASVMDCRWPLPLSRTQSSIWGVDHWRKV